MPRKPALRAQPDANGRDPDKKVIEKARTVKVKRILVKRRPSRGLGGKENAPTRRQAAPPVIDVDTLRLRYRGRSTTPALHDLHPPMLVTAETE